LTVTIFQNAEGLRRGAHSESKSVRIWQFTCY